MVSRPDERVDELERADVLVLRRVFDAAREDIPTLQRLKAVLTARNTDASIELQAEIVLALRRLRGAAGTRGGGSAPPLAVRHRPTDALQEVLSDRGLDGANAEWPLWKYRTSDAAYSALCADVRARARGPGRLGDPRGAAMFALVAAEWFRREHRGGMRRWDDLATGLGVVLSHADARDVAERGLKWWRRNVRKGAGGDRHFLMTLAVEGGFPSRLLDTEGRKSWLSDHLQRLTDGLEAADATFEQVLGLSAALSEGIPRTYRNEEFHALCADLCLEVARLRREIRAEAPPGVKATAWLDDTQPDWREWLPIRLEGEAPRVLLDQLVLGPARRVSDEVGCIRLLVRRAENWLPALRIKADGVLRTQDGFDGRLRVQPVGETARWFGGELAVVDAPSGDEPRSCRARAASRMLAVGFPFRSDLVVELQADGRSRGTLSWPKGEAVRSDCLVFAANDAEDDPDKLILIGRGSVRTRRSPVWVWTPASYEAVDIDGGSLEPIWNGGEQALYRIERSSCFGPLEGGDRYRVTPGATSEDADHLSIVGDPFRGALSIDGVPLLAGSPSVRVRRDGVDCAATASQLAWRPVGERGWRRWTSAGALPRGVVEIAWRDEVANVLIDKIRLGVLPAGARLQATARGVKTRYRSENMPGWRLTLGAGEPGVWEADGDEWLLSSPGLPVRTRRLVLHGPAGETFQIEASSPTAGSGFARADGRMLHNGEIVHLEQLRGATAFGQGAQTLWVRPLDAQLGAVGRQAIPFQDEIALGGLRETIDAMLAGLGSGIDATVQLDLPGAELRVRRYADQVERQGDAIWFGAEALTGDRLEWLSLARPAEGARLLTAAVERTALLRASLPADAAGPGVAYLRRGETVVGRPRFAPGAPLETASGDSELSAICEIPDPAERNEAFDRALARLTTDGETCSACLRYLHALLAARGTVPASAFDVLGRLPRRPAAAAALVLSAARREAAEAVWSLEKETPLLWRLVSVDAWRCGATAAVQAWTAILTSLEEGAAPLARDLVAQRVQEVLDFDATLAPGLHRAGLAARPPTISTSLDEAAQNYVRRNAGSRESQAGSANGAVSDLFRGDSLFSPSIPAWPFDPAFSESLSAPVAAALVAAGKVQGVTWKQRFRIRLAQADDPQYFAEAYAAAFATFT